MNNPNTHEYEALYKSLMERLPIGVYRTLPDGTIIHANTALAKILGFQSAEELIGHLRSSETYVNPSEREEQLREWKRSGGICNFETRLITHDGRVIWVLDRGNVMLDEQGNIQYIDGIIQDITTAKSAREEMIRAKEKAEEMSRMKTNFLASMSHELRTPLFGIIGFTELLQKEIHDPEYSEWFELIYRSGKRLSETLDQIMQFAKLESEKMELNLTEINCTDIITDILELNSPLAEKKGLYLRQKHHTEVCNILTDERMLRSIIQNLINNAIKFTVDGGVTIETNLEENLMVLTISDTGIGISRTKLPIIFDEFRQASEGKTRSFEGVGLGLTLTRKFVELLQGTISVESEPGVGSKFIVKLPGSLVKGKSAAPAGQDIKKPSEPTSPALAGMAEVLLVEDDDTNRKLIIAGLSKNFRTEGAGDGIQALRKVHEKKYDAIVMDINLGEGMSGLEVARKVRFIEGYEATPIIAVTAFAMPGEREEFLENGCTHYLAKPFSFQELINLLHQVLAS